MFRISTLTLLVLPVLIGSSGCNSSPEGPELIQVSGNVTYDGQPLEDGRIRFRLTSGDLRAFETDIVDGKYALETYEGPMQVEVRASRIVPGKFEQASPDDEPQPVGEMFIPEKYNAKTTLTAEVTPDGDNEFPFDLTSGS